MTPIPEEKKKGVVYEVPCKDCHRVYIGKTKRTPKVRLGGHKQAVKRGDLMRGLLFTPMNLTMPLTEVMTKKNLCLQIVAKKSNRGHLNQKK